MRENGALPSRFGASRKYLPLEENHLTSEDDHLIADTFSALDRRWVASVLGVPVLAWAANVDEAAIEDWLKTSHWLEEPHAESLDELAAAALRLRDRLLNQEGRSPGERTDREIAADLTRVLPATGLSLVSAVRVRADGPPARSTLATPSQRAIEEVVWHVWPSVLAFDGAARVYDALIDDLVAELRQDDALAPILRQRAGYVLTIAPGIGRGAYDPRSMSASLVAFGVERARNVGQWPDRGAVVKGALEGLDLVYELGRGRRVRLPAVVAFTDVTVPPAWRMNVSGGVLRTPHDAERRHGDGGTGLVLETTLPTRFSATEVANLTDWRALPGRDEYHRAREVASDRVVLAFALAFGADAVPRTAWSHVSNPLTDTWMSEIHGGQPGAPLQVGSRRMVEVEQWLGLIDARMTSQLEIAVRRTVASMTERGDPRDALIDAVIAWDALVGASGETVLRVTASLAVLLEEDTCRRLPLQRELKDIYSLRSGLVHGSKRVTETEAHRAHLRALDIALQSLREIIRDRPDLAALNASERSTRLLLGVSDSAEQCADGDERDSAEG